MFCGLVFSFFSGVLANEIFKSSGGQNFKQEKYGLPGLTPDRKKLLSDIYDAPFNKEWMDALRAKEGPFTFDQLVEDGDARTKLYTQWKDGRRPGLALTTYCMEKLIQDCWHQKKSRRPEFAEIVQRLEAHHAKYLSRLVARKNENQMKLRTTTKERDQKRKKERRNKQQRNDPNNYD